MLKFKYHDFGRLKKIHNIFLKKAIYILLILFTLLSVSKAFSSDAAHAVIYSVLKLALGLFPIIFFIKNKLANTHNPLIAIYIITYYIIILPCINPIFIDLNDHIAKNNIFRYSYIITEIVNLSFLIYCHYILFNYVFVDFFSRKRVIVTIDILIIILTYITIACSFGFVYFITSLIYNKPCLGGIGEDVSLYDSYFYHIYFSFITISTTGFGDLYPNQLITRFLSVVEIIIGMVITNVVLGLIIGSGILNARSKNTDDDNK